MYSLFLIFLSIPLAFSHVFARFGASWIIDNGIGHFESVKVHLVLVLLIVATFEMSLTHSQKFLDILHKYTHHILLGFCILVGGYFFYEPVSGLSFWLGVGEKQHGYAFMIGLIWLGVLCSLIAEKERRCILFGLLFSAFLVALEAIGEFFGYNAFTGAQFTTSGSWGAIRSISTLGNPNYLAGFLLMVFPWISMIEQRYIRGILFLVFIFAIYTSGSFIASVLLGLFICSRIIRIFHQKWLYPILILTTLIGGGIIYSMTLESDKWLSLVSRFILMKHTLMGSIESFFPFLFGYGPDAVMHFFSVERHTEIRAYFPDAMIIDSSHHILIDILAQYGLFGLVLFLGFILYRSRKLSSLSRESVFLGLAFLSLNVLVLSHMMVLIFALIYEK